MRKFILLLALFSTAKALSVGLVTQYYLGSEFISKACSFEERDKHLFLLGVWFPGIWYTSKQAAQKLRMFDALEIQTVLQEQDPFKKGILFHHFLHSHEKKYFENSYLSKSLDDQMPYLIQECYLNIIEDALMTREELVEGAKVLLNDILYRDFNLENFSDQYKLSDIIKWYYTIFVSVTTNPLEIPDHITFSNIYKGLKVTIEITPQMLIDAKNKLPQLVKDESISTEIQAYINLMRSFF